MQCTSLFGEFRKVFTHTITSRIDSIIVNFTIAGGPFKSVSFSLFYAFLSFQQEKQLLKVSQGQEVHRETTQIKCLKENIQSR